MWKRDSELHGAYERMKLARRLRLPSRGLEPMAGIEPPPRSCRGRGLPISDSGGAAVTKRPDSGVIDRSRTG